MKPEYKEKLNRMKKGANGYKVAVMLIENDYITPDMIVETLGIKNIYIHRVISTMRYNGWNIVNLSRRGEPARWQLRGVKQSASMLGSFPRPKLHPLIEKVFC